MSQASPTIGANKSGLTYRQEDNDGKKALLNHHKASTAPDYAEAGTIWLDDADTPWLLKMHDGTDWITLGGVNAATNAFHPYLGTAAAQNLAYAADTGAANAYAVAPVPAITAYEAGHQVILKPGNSNTGASTLAVSGLTAKTIRMPDGSALPALAMLSTGLYNLVYNGADFTLLNPHTPAHLALATISSSADFNTLTASGIYLTLGSGYSNAPPLGGSGHTGALIIYNRATSPPALNSQLVQKWINYNTGEEWNRATSNNGALWTIWGKSLTTATSGAVIDRAYASYTTNTNLTATIPHDDSLPQNTEGTEILSASITPKDAANRLRVTFTGFGNAGSAANIAAALFQDGTANALAAVTTGCTGASAPGCLTLRYEFVPGSASSTTLKIRVGASSGTMRMNGSAGARLFGGGSTATLTIEEIAG